MDSRELVERIAALAEEKSAEDITVLDMRRVSGLCNYFVIASATSSVRAKTIAEHVEKELKVFDQRVIGRDGLRDGQWVVLDFSDVMVHVFVKELREFYNLEQLWGDAPRVRVEGLGKKGKGAKE